MHRIFWLISLLWVLPTWAQSIQWQTLAPGFEYTTIQYQAPYSSSKLHAFRIDPKLYQFHSITAKVMQRKVGLISSFAKNQNALLAVNGGFFNSDYEPIGLRINQSKIISPIKLISWWEIFYLQNNKPAIVASSSYQPNEGIQFAIQSGPRLLANGIIPALKDGADLRSAICITQTNKIVITVTEHLPLTTKTLATILKTPEANGGFSCRDALNLDGGNSSQLYAKVANKTISVPNLSPVTDVIVIKPI